MALSGTLSTNVGAHWRLRLTWSATQSLTGNYSDVTTRLYWETRTSYGNVNSSATKSGAITIDGTVDTYSGSGLANLNNGQSKQIATSTKRITHNSNGTKSFSLSAYFDLDLPLSGTSYGRISIPSQSFTLDTIPRVSTVSSSASWTAGNNLAVTISRASSSFYHTVRVYVNNVLIRSVNGVQTSHNFSFTVAENTTIFQQLNGASSRATRIEVVTYTGATNMGTTQKTGVVSAPVASVNTVRYGTVQYFDEGFDVSLNRANSAFKHTIKYIFEDTTMINQSSIDTFASFTFTPSQLNTMYGLIPNKKTGRGRIEITTFYNGVQVRDVVNHTLNFTLRNSNPTFNSSQISYADVNSSTVSTTGDDQYIIQNKSSLRVYVNSAATALNGATIARYVISVPTKSDSTITSTGSALIGTVNSSTNQVVRVKAIDSRGFETEVSKTILIVPYTSPTINVQANRVNKFESDTNLNVFGTFSNMSIGGVSKNTITRIDYATRLKGTSTWSSESVITPINISGNVFSINPPLINLDNTKSYEIKVDVTDSYDQYSTIVSVNQGQPIMFIDSVRKSVGVGKFPTNDDSFETVGNIYAGGDIFTNGIKVTSIVEEGANANGRYVKYQDGIMICWLYTIDLNTPVDTPYGSLYHGVYDWTYPSTFFTIPTVTCSLFRSGNTGGWGSVATDPNTTGALLRGTDVSLRVTGRSVAIGAMAIGRWKA